MGLRILICDDSPMIHRILSITLEKLGHVVCGIAQDGQEAVDKYLQLLPDAVFMDITMPVMDGIEATKNIKEQKGSAKIVILSAMADSEIKQQAQLVGVYAFLKKPIAADRIADVLQAIEKEKEHG